MNVNVSEKILSAPKEPGVYIFYKGEKTLYVGKAANLRARLKSYLKINDIKTRSLNDEANRLELLVLASDIEALIEESRLIKSLKPKYNVIFRDDKSYSYVAFTQESFPRVFVTHKNPKVRNLKLKLETIGPFTESGSLRMVMKLLRRKIPYCTCTQKHLRDCLNAQIGKCPGICCKKNSTESPAHYRKNINKIKSVLKGRGQKILRALTDEQELRAVRNVLEHKFYIESDANRTGTTTVLEKINRLECYDNSNFAGKEAVGAMTALVKTGSGWIPDKSGYRKFIIKNTPTQDDPRMIGELITRRLNHPEWPYPDMIIIDGGLTQFRAAKNAALEAFQKLKIENSKLKIISFAKPHKLVYGLRPNDIPTPLLELSKEFQEVIDRAIYQTHNFVIRFHREKRARAFIPSD